MILIIIIAVLIFLIIILIKKVDIPQIKGSIGESGVSKTLSYLPPDYIPMHDIMIKNSKGKTSQIDHLVLSEYGIFVIETKNYKGWIFGNEKSEYWTQVIYKEKNKFRNPIKQNWSHIYALRDILSGYKRIKYFPIVVFTGRATLKDIESKAPVIYETSLNQIIKNNSNLRCLTNEEVQKIKEVLESIEIIEKDFKKEHIHNIHKNITEKQSKERNLICPRCNSELKLRNGKYGKFYGCSSYPKCKFTMKY